MHPYRFLITRMAARATTRAALAIVSLLAVAASVLMSAAPAEAAGVTLHLIASPTTLLTGQSSTLIATASSNLFVNQRYIRIYDTTGGVMTPVNSPHSCKFGLPCSVSVTQPLLATHRYRARLENVSGNPDAGSDSNTSYVTWTGSNWQLFLSAGAGPNPFSATLSATANHDVGPTPYYISIFKEDGPNRTAGTLLASCGSGTTCVTVVSADCPFSDYVAFLTPYPQSSVQVSIQASSNIMTVYGFFCFFPATRPALPSPIPNSPISPQRPKA